MMMMMMNCLFDKKGFHETQAKTTTTQLIKLLRFKQSLHSQTTTTTKQFYPFKDDHPFFSLLRSRFIFASNSIRVFLILLLICVLQQTYRITSLNLH